MMKDNRFLSINFVVLVCTISLWPNVKIYADRWAYKDENCSILV
jgi:hypothetical protein